MLAFLFAAGLNIHPWDLVRVDDPDHPDAITTSETGALLLEAPPPGTPWRPASVPVPDVEEGGDLQVQDSLAVTNAHAWHKRGITGEGVKVAIFDMLWFGAEIEPEDLGDNVFTHDCHTQRSCELPIDTFRPTFGFEEGRHGFACGEVVHDLAPDAEIHLVRTNSFTTFENAVDWAIREDIDIISQSLSYFNNSFYDGSGRFAPYVTRLEAHDVLLVTSSGNSAREHWQSRWTDGDNDGRLDGDGDNGIWIYFSAGRHDVHVTWNQYGRCGDTDLDATVFDGDRRIVGKGRRKQDADADECSPMERITANTATSDWYRLEVEYVAGSTAWLHVDVHAKGGSVSDGDPGQGAIVDPGSHPLAFTVGAVNAKGYLRNDVESFSSQGPTHAGHPKPDIAGPDGVTTAALGSRGFFGTSASTPAVAGLLALVLSEDPSLTPRQAAQRLQGWALTDAAQFEQPDPRWGAGKARLPVNRDRPTVCGRRPLLMPLLILPFSFFRRRRRDADDSGRVCA